MGVVYPGATGDADTGLNQFEFGTDVFETHMMPHENMEIKVIRCRREMRIDAMSLMGHRNIKKSLRVF